MWSIRVLIEIIVSVRSLVVGVGEGRTQERLTGRDRESTSRLSEKVRVRSRRRIALSEEDISSPIGDIGPGDIPVRVAAS